MASASDVDLILGTIAFAVDAHGLGVVQYTVEQSRGQNRVIVKDGGPLLIDPVCCDQCGAAFVAVTNDLKQAVSAELVDREIAKLVDAKNLRFDVGVQRTFNATGGMRVG